MAIRAFLLLSSRFSSVIVTRMANSFTVGRAQLLFALCLPVAILLGYLLSDPLDPSNSLFVLILVGLLAIPLLIRGHHVALIFAWNAAITPAFLPGQPFLWVPLAVIGLGFAIVNRFTSAEAGFSSTPSVSRPLLFLLMVTLVTAALRGGFGLRSFGSETYGGRNYAYIVAAILGYFTLSSQRIPLEKVDRYVALFFLTGLTSLIPNLAYLGGRSWFFLFNLFPPVYAIEQALGDVSLDMQIARVFGLSFASIALLSWLLAHYGLRKVFNWRYPGALFLFVVSLTACVFCGFRSFLIIFLLCVGLQFIFEGLLTTRNFLVGSAVLLVIAGLVLPNASKLPLVVQRTLSFLPLRLNPVAEMSAEGSTAWRLEMWRVLLPQIPQYFFKGKGFGIDSTDLALAEQNNRFGMGFEGAIAAGDYHSGPLSLIIPLGVWGVIGFAWFVIASIRYLHKQYRFGDPQLQRINTFLLAYFIAKLILFLFVFGGFFSDLFFFTGIVGFSASLNGNSIKQQDLLSTNTQTDPTLGYAT